MQTTLCLLSVLAQAETYEQLDGWAKACKIDEGLSKLDRKYGVER